MEDGLASNSPIVLESLCKIQKPIRQVKQILLRTFLQESAEGDTTAKMLT